MNFEKHRGKKDKMLAPSIFSFSSMFSTLSQQEIIFLPIFYVLSANAFNSSPQTYAFGEEVKAFST